MLKEGRETSELDGEGGRGAFCDDAGMSNVIPDAGIDSFLSSSDVPLESVTNDNLNYKIVSTNTKKKK